MRALLSAAFTVAVVGMSSVASAAAPKPHVTLHLSGVLVQNGKATATPVDRASLKRGDVVLWTIVAENDGSKPALRVSPTDQVPNGMTFVAGSAKSAVPAATQYTLDGRTWSPRPMVKVTQKNGQVVSQPADPASYHAVRWVLARPLAPHQRASVSFETRVL